MRRLAEAWADLADEPGPAMDEPRAGDGGIGGYDAWKLATPPEYEYLGEPPRYERRRPVTPGMCARRRFPSIPWLCTRPANHNGDCDTFGEER